MVGKANTYTQGHGRRSVPEDRVILRRGRFVMTGAPYHLGFHVRLFVEGDRNLDGYVDSVASSTLPDDQASTVEAFLADRIRKLKRKREAEHDRLTTRLEAVESELRAVDEVGL